MKRGQLPAELGTTKKYLNQKVLEFKSYYEKDQIVEVLI